VAGLLADLDGRYPGIRFRMVNEIGALRPHVRIFVNREATTDLERTLSPRDEIVILQALSGG
jgi:molybdopterin converting factor small subunit